MFPTSEMAAKKDEGKEVNYVAIQNFWKENYGKARIIQRAKWPDEWGYIVPLYQQAYEKMTQGNKEPPPEKMTHVNKEIVASLQTNAEKKRPCRSVPPPDTQMYGWKVGCSIVETVDKWIETRPQMSMYRELGWGWDSQP